MKHFYIIGSFGDDRFKLGFADNVGKRLCELQIGNPSELVVSDCTPVKNHEQFESFVHRAFNDCLVRGEWYRLSLADAQLLYDNVDNVRVVCDCPACNGKYSVMRMKH